MTLKRFALLSYSGLAIGVGNDMGLLKNRATRFRWHAQTRLRLALKSRQFCFALSGLFMVDGFDPGLRFTAPWAEICRPFGAFSTASPSAGFRHVWATIFGQPQGLPLRVGGFSGWFDNVGLIGYNIGFSSLEMN